MQSPASNTMFPAGKTLEANLAPEEWHESITRGTTTDNVAHSVQAGIAPRWIDPVMAETVEGDTVLELGSGTGELSAHVARRGRATMLFDFSADSLKFAAEVYGKLGIQGKFVQGDVLKRLPFDDRSIDVIWSSGLLEHFPDHEIAHIISESARVAKKRVISLVPNAASLPYRLGKDWQERTGRWIWGKEDPKASLEQVFRAAGLDRIREYSIAPEHALNFLDAPELASLRSEMTKVFAALPAEALKAMNQGYLLVTIGEVPVAQAAMPQEKKTVTPTNKKIRCLVCVPNDPLEAYAAAGYPDLTDYFNPGKTFDEVYCVSPLENREYTMYGMRVIPSSVAGFARRVQELGADCVRAYDIPAGQIACAERVPGVPVICSVHDVNPARCPGPLPDADYFLAISHAVEKFLRDKGADPTRILKFANRVDMDVFRPIRDEAKRAAFQRRFPGKYRILLVGRRTPQKNLDTLIRALALLGEDYTGIFVGQGDAAPYLKMAGELGVAGRCHFVDAVPNAELAEFYSFSDCFCTPSRWEGFGIVFIEALASEAVIVTSDIAPMNEFVKQGESGILVRNYENPTALSEEIRRAVQDQTLRAHLKSNARRAAEPFSKTAIAAQESEIYNTVMQKAADPAPRKTENPPPVAATAPQAKTSAHSNSNLKIHPLSADLEKQWEELIATSPDAWFYHSFAEQLLLEEAWPVQTLSFMLERNGKMIALFPLQRRKHNPVYAASTLMGPAGPALSKDLSPGERAEVMGLLYAALPQYCSSLGVKQVEIPLPPLTPTAVSLWQSENPLLKYGFEDRSTVTTVIDLAQSEDDILKHFGSSHRYVLKQAQQLGMEIFRAQGPTALDDYYALHVETYTRTGVQPHPKAYFDAIYRHFVAKGKAHWFMARYQGRMLGAMNMAVFGQGSLYWTGAYSQEGLDLGVGRLLQWEAIRFAKSLGLRYHETGEVFPDAAQGTKEHGLSFYKRGFGGALVPFRKGVLNIR